MTKNVARVAWTIVAFVSLAAGVVAQSAKESKRDDQNPTARVRIELTGGDSNKPISDASVYVKFYEDQKSRKGKTAEINLKTNQEGVARSPEIPQGKVLVQVVVEGWKTYGQWHDVNESEQTIQIHLVRPAGY